MPGTFDSVLYCTSDFDNSSLTCMIGLVGTLFNFLTTNTLVQGGGRDAVEYAL